MLGGDKRETILQYIYIYLFIYFYLSMASARRISTSVGPVAHAFN